MTDKKSALEALNRIVDDLRSAKLISPAKNVDIETIRTALNAAPEVVTADQLMDRINRSHYNYLCMVDEIRRVFPDGVKVVEAADANNHR